MSTTPVSQGTHPRGSAADAATPRVRHQARDAVAVMTFSVVTSSIIALALLLLARAGH